VRIEFEGAIYHLLAHGNEGRRGVVTNCPAPDPAVLGHDIFGQGPESLSVGLQHRDGNVAGLARRDVPDNARFADVSAADDFTFRAVRYLACRFGFHVCGF